MFELLRSWIKPVIYITLAFFVALIVLEWGADFSSSNRFNPNSGIVGVVNGEEIPNEQYQRAYQNLYNQQFGGRDVTPSDAELERIRTQAWNNIVAEMALQQEIAKRDIDISDQDLYYYLRYNPPAFLQSQPIFQTDGKFDYQKYMGIMADPGNASMWAAVEQSVIPQVQTAKMQEVITTAARVTANEVREAFMQNSEKAHFEIVTRPIASLPDSGVEVSDAELRNYLNKHEYRFQREEMRSIRVALFSKEVTEEDWERVGSEMAALADSMKADTAVTFAEWARSYSEDATAPDGGELGFYAIQDLDSFYVNGALGVDIGEVSGPVRSTFGWHVIKLNGIRDSSGAETTDPAKAAEINTAHILLRVQASDETVASAERRARTFHHTASELGFEAAAAQLGVEIKTVAPFQKGGSIQFLGSDYFAGEWAFNSEIGDISGIYDNAANYFVMELTGEISGGTIPLEDIRASLENLVRNEKLKQMSLDTLQAVYSELQAGAEMEAAATKHGATYVKTSAMLTRNNPLPPPVGRDPIAVGLAFSLREPGELSEPTIADRGAVIIRLLEKETPGLDAFNQARDSVAANLLNMKQNALWQNWYSNIVKNAVSENYLERQIAESRAQADTGVVF